MKIIPLLTNASPKPAIMYRQLKQKLVCMKKPTIYAAEYAVSIKRGGR